MLAVLCVVSCQQPATKPDLDAERQALKSAVAGYHASATPATIDELKGHYTSTARAMPPDLRTIQGQDSLAKFFDGFKTLKNFTATFSEPEVVVASGGDMGYSFATATLSWEDGEGKTTRENIRDIHIWIKQADGSWKIELDIWNEVEDGEDED